jgi:hypothetical protein
MRKTMLGWSAAVAERVRAARRVSRRDFIWECGFRISD